MIQAARQHRRLEVDYVSLKAPDREGRIIVPHTLVFTGFRWHVRAWCEKNRDFRDFVLSRFRGEAEIMDPSDSREEQDERWQTKVSIELTPDPRLSPGQQDVVAADYGMQDGVLKLETRGTLVSYLLQLYQLDSKLENPNPLAQQIVIKNQEALKPWLFT